MSSFFIDGNGNRYSLGVAQATINGRVYVRPTASTYTDAGLTEVTIDPRPNDRFYSVSGPDNTGAYTSTPRDLAELKANFVKEQKKISLQLLSGTDWYVIRNVEDSTSIPAAVTTYRAGVRSVCAANEVLINAVADVDELAALIAAPPEVLETPGDAESAFIANPDDHLDTYPELDSQY